MDCDAVVVGGGFAGVTAARELASRGLHTVLLEARDRLGGRTWTTEFAGETLEMGGTFIHWRQPHVWAEMTRYRLPIVDNRATPRPFDVLLAGKPLRRISPEEAAEAVAKTDEVFNRFVGSPEDRAALPRPYDPLFNPALLERDTLSMQDRLDEIGLSAADQELISRPLASMAGSPLNEAGLTPVLRWLALAEWDMDKWDEENRYRPEGHTISLIEAIVADGEAEVRLSTPVSAVAVSGDGVRVTTRSGEVVSAPVGVMAIPGNCWPTIDFSPALPQSHREVAAMGLGKPQQDRVFVRARSSIGRVSVSLPGGEPLQSFSTVKELDDGTQLITGANSTPALDVHDADQVAETIHGYVPELEVLEVFGHSWGADEFARGANTFYRPNQLRYLADLQRPLGRLAFAGADIASGYFGNMDGAIESGLRAAAQCLEAIPRSRKRNATALASA